jgi:hypothetical protein
VRGLCGWGIIEFNNGIFTMRKVKLIARNAAIIFIAGLLTACGGGAGSGSASGNPGGVTEPAKTLAVLGANILDGAPAVDPRATFQLFFSGPLGAAGLGSDQVQLTDGSKTYPIKIDIAGSAMTVTPVANLKTRTDYRIIVKAGATGADGSVLISDYALKFRTLLAVYESKQLTPADRSVFNGINAPRIKIADVNGDGRADLVELAALYRPDLFAANGYTLNIYLQDATGRFDKLQKLELVSDQIPYSKYFSNLIVLDIDGDNKPELLVPEYRPDDEATAGIRVFKAGTDGKFAAHEFIATNYTETLQALDVDGDGKIDLVGGNRRAIDQVTGGFQVLLGTPTGFTKLAPVQMPFGGYEFGIGDLDQDGKPELIVNRLFAKANIGPLTTELLIYSQGTAGVFSLNTALTNETTGFCTNADYCRDMRIVDLNGDGKPELVFAAQTEGSASKQNLVIAFSRQAGGGLNKKFQVALGSSVFGIQDMDGDGLPDLLVIGPCDGCQFYSIIGGGPNFSLEFANTFFVPVFDNMYPANVAIGDIDGDGRPDVIFDSYNSGIAMGRQVKL